MIRKFFLISLFVFLTNCSSPGTAFLGPVFTGAKTGSVYQASLSYSSNKIVNNIIDFKELSSSLKDNSFISNKKNTSTEPLILTSFVVAKSEVSEVLEPEPLP